MRPKFPEAFELFYAVFEGSVNEVKSRLVAGDDPNAASAFGSTPIFYATRFYWNLDKADALFSAGAVINRWDDSGGHPLHYSVRCDDCLTWLINHGADVNAVVLQAKEIQFDPIGWTALHVAARHGYLSATELLLKCGADPNRQAQDGSTPLHIAAQHYNLYKRLIRTLIDAGADVNAVNNAGNTPLHEVISRPNKHANTVIRLLLFRGARLDLRNASGLTASEMLPDTPFGNMLKSLFARHMPKTE
jgi:hypothetical protein